MLPKTNKFVLDETTRVASTSFLPLFQQRNFSLALAATTQALGKKFTAKRIEEAARTHIPGRMEVLAQNNKTIILDGAHNPQKLYVLAQSLPLITQGQKVAALVAFTNSRSRDIAPMLAELAPIVSHLIITELPDDGVHTTRPAEDIAAACSQAGISSYIVVADTGQALQTLRSRTEPMLLVTGSFYLLRYVRPRLR